MKYLTKLGVAILLSGSAIAGVAAQERNPELVAASEEWLRYHNARQYDAAIAAGHKRLRLADQLAPGDTLERAEAANTLAMSYHGKNDLANAQLFYERSLAIHEKLGGSSICRTVNSLGNVAFWRVDMASAARLFERALTCFETLRGPADSQTIAAMFDLIEAYNYPVYRPDLAAKADLLAQRWLPLVERAKGADHIDVARLLREQGKALAARNDAAGARAVRKRALAIAAKQPDPGKPDSARMAVEAGALLDLVMAYRGSEIDAEYTGYEARRLAIMERIKGANAPDTIALRRRVAELRERFPEPSAPVAAPVRQAVVPAAPFRPAQTSSGGTSIIQAAPGRGGKSVWPVGMESGNLYFVVRIGSGGEDELPTMVASASAPEAIERLRQASLREWGRQGQSGPISARVLDGGTCAGPAWGAVVSNVVNGQKLVWGGGCGKTPAQALEAAFASCRKAGAVTCDTVGQPYMERRQISLALSGKTSSGNDSCGSCKDSFGSFNAFTAGPYAGAHTTGLADAIAKLGKPCSNQPCYLTTATASCFDLSDPQVRIAKCTDPRLTPDGYSGPLR